jgi:hypothetical protein
MRLKMLVFVREDKFRLIHAGGKAALYTVNLQSTEACCCGVGLLLPSENHLKER